MSYLFESLGRGLVTHLTSIFDAQLPSCAGDDRESLLDRLAQAPTSLDLLMRLGRVELRAGATAEARAAFERAAAEHPAARDPQLGLACVYAELGDLTRERSALRAARKCDPRDPAIAFATGLWHERSGAIEAARSSYRKALALCPRLRNAYERLAAIALHQHQLDEALACYQELADLAPDDLDVLLTLGTLYLENQRPNDAAEQFQMALLVEPDCDERALPTNLEIDAGGEDDRIAALERVVAEYPDLALYRVRLADLYARVGEDDAALQNYQAALAVKPNFLEATVKLGTQHLRNGRLIAAAQSFNQATELNDRLTLAFVGLGVAQWDAGAPAEARATFDLAASVEPSSTLLLSETARLHFNACDSGAFEREEPDADSFRGDSRVEWTLEDVIQRHRRALAARRGHAELSYRYGVLLRQAGRQRQAMDAFRQAVEAVPTFTKAHVRLGVSEREHGNDVQGIDHFRRALQHDRAQVAAQYGLAVLFTQPNRFQMAIDTCDADGSPTEHCRQNLDLMLQNVGLLDRVAATWRGLCDLSADADDLIQRRREALAGKA